MMSQEQACIAVLRECGVKRPVTETQVVWGVVMMVPHHQLSSVPPNVWGMPVWAIKAPQYANEVLTELVLN